MASPPKAVRRASPFSIGARTAAAAIGGRFRLPRLRVVCHALTPGEVPVAGLAYTEAVHSPIEVEFRRWCHLQPSLASLLDGAKQITKLTAISPLAGRARVGGASFCWAMLPAFST